MKKWIAIFTAASLMSLAACAASGGAKTESPTDGEQTTVGRSLTAGEALDLALDHAGLSADRVTGLRAEYELDDGVPEYEVEFRQGDHEYDYTVHAETGKVLQWDKEYDPVTPRPTEPTEVTPSATEPIDAPPSVTEPTAPAKEKLTAEEAKAAALRHAGLSADQVTELTAHYEWDDGVPEYEVEFRMGDHEYDYTVHAETGKVLEWDKEYDPVK